MARISRRSIGALALASILPGCGWRPVYATAPGGGDGPAEQGLAETEVLLIPERNGQLLREALKGRFERGTSGTARRYDLSVNVGVSGEAIGVQRDSTSSRVRLIATATWVLRGQDPQRTTLIQGVTRDVDAYNVYDQQFFAADLESEAVQRRMMDSLAEKLTLQLAAWFAHRATG